MRIGFAIAMGLGMLLSCAGCRSKTAPVPPPTEPLDYDEADDDGEAPGATKAGGKRAAGCKAAGTPWDGRQAGCLYEVEGCCYPEAESACAAAGCDAGSCQILEFSPAQITCRAR